MFLLHSFEYDDAIEAFRQSQKIDPGFVMAYWGEAMCYNQPLWCITEARQILGSSNRWTNAETAEHAEETFLCGFREFRVERRVPVTR